MKPSLKKQNYHRLVFSGGGNRSAFYLGMLKAFGQKRLNKITHFVGVSLGSILASLISMGLTIEEILQGESEMPFEFYYSWLLTSPFTCFQKGGCVDIEHLRQLFTKWIQKSKPECLNWTFQTLYDKRKIILEIQALCTVTAERVVFNVQTNPNMLILKAMVASCAIPIAFTPYYHEKTIIIDGGLFISVPWQSLNRKPFINCSEYCACNAKTKKSKSLTKHSNSKKSKFNTLGLLLDYKQDNNVQQLSLIALFHRFLTLPINSLHLYEFKNNDETCHDCEKTHECKTGPEKKLIRATVDNSEFGMFSNVFPSREQKMEFYKSGFKQAKEQNI